MNAQNIQSFAVKGMHCASCANVIERAVSKLEGVSAASANYATESLKLTFSGEPADPQLLARTLKPLGYELVLPKPVQPAANAGEPAPTMRDDKAAELDALRNKVLVSMPLVAISATVMAWDILAGLSVLPAMTPVWSEFFHHLMPLFATNMLFAVGAPYLIGLYRFVRYGAASMDTLIGLGTCVAFLYSFALTAFEEPLRPYLDVTHNYYDVTIVVIGFITLGKFLEARARLRTGDAMQALLGLQARTALILRDGQEVEVPVGEIVAGDVLVIRPGARIPVDGIGVEGASFVDESMVTGEPMPAGRGPGDTLIGGTLNTTGTMTMRATRIGADTVLAGIIRMVSAAQGSKAPVQALADRISAVFVPAVLVVAAVAFAAWLAFGVPALGFGAALSHGLSAFVGVLVIACPCALGLATPTAIIVGVGKGARAGILVKDAATLEKLAAVDTVVIDKTGTLTKGAPELVGIDVLGSKSENDILMILASLEDRSEHPVARAIVSAAKARNIVSLPVGGFESATGQGVSGTFGGVTHLAGNAKMMADLGHSPDDAVLAERAAAGKTPVYLATQKELLGVAWVADEIKPNSPAAVAALKNLGLKVVMLSGDNLGTARYMAERAGIDEVEAEMSPAQKLDFIKALQAKGHTVAMAGDGVNDAPALAQADVGIAMSTGTDVAIDTAGLTLLHGDLARLASAVRLARQTMTTIRQNLFWAFAFNVIGIPLAAGALFPAWGLLLSPVFAGAAMAFSSVAVVTNSLRLKLSGVHA